MQSNIVNDEYLNIIKQYNYDIHNNKNKNNNIIINNNIKELIIELIKYENDIIKNNKKIIRYDVIWHNKSLNKIFNIKKKWLKIIYKIRNNYKLNN